MLSRIRGFRMKKVRLRSFRNEDIPLKIKWDCQEDSVRNIFRRTRTDKEAKEGINNIVNNDDRSILMIELDGIGIGYILYEIEWYNRLAELSVVVGDERYNKLGYGLQAWGLAINLGFQELNLHKIFCCFYSVNQDMYNIFRRFGVEKDALLRERACLKGKYYDFYYLSFLSTDKNTKLLAFSNRLLKYNPNNDAQLHY
jgi:RimJ/RimL family protein N-acetyltransferase